MSHDGKVPVFPEVKYRFTGAEAVDNALFAIAYFVDALTLLLTLGWWSLSLSVWYTDHIQDVFFEQYGNGMRPHDEGRK